MIYFMQPPDGGPVKIGHSDNVERRRGELEVRYGRPLVILAVMHGGPEEEQQAHERFAHLRLGRTEQFRPGPDLLTHLGQPIDPGMNPDAVEAMEVVEPDWTEKAKKPVILQVRGNPGYKAALEELVEFDGLGSVSVLFDRAIRYYARHISFPKPFPKR